MENEDDKEALFWVMLLQDRDEKVVRTSVWKWDREVSTTIRTEVASLSRDLDGAIGIFQLYLSMKFSMMELQKALNRDPNSFLTARSRRNPYVRSDLYSELSLRLTSYLSACVTFKERTCRILRENGRGSKADEIDTRASFFFDSFLSYALCYNLRNHATHHGFPFKFIDMHFLDSPSFPIIFSIEKRSLIENERLNSGFRDRLRRMPEANISLYELAQDFFLMHVSMFEISMEAFSREIEKAAERHKDFSRYIPNGKIGMPAFHSNDAEGYLQVYPQLNRSRQIPKELRWIERYKRNFRFSGPPDGER